MQVSGQDVAAFGEQELAFEEEITVYYKFAFVLF